MMKSSKGQFSIEYVVSIVIFVSMAAYIIFLVYDLVPEFVDQSNEETLRAKALEISEIMFGTEGHPDPWDSNNVEVVGLSMKNDPFVLNKTKIDELENTDYQKIKDGYDLEGMNFTLTILNASDTGETILNITGGEPFRRAVNIIRPLPMYDEINDEYTKTKAFLVVWRYPI